MDYDVFLQMIKKRRSTRKFKPDPIPDEAIEKIIEAARWAPSGANSQPWDFIVIKDGGIRKKIAQFIKDFLSIHYRLEHTREKSLQFPSASRPADKIGYEDAPVYIIICGDKRTKQAYPLYTSVEISEAILESSLANAFLYMQLAAGTLGLGSQWVSVVRVWYLQCLIRDLLQIPYDFVLYDVFVAGYSASQPKPRMVRAKEEMIHEDYYDNDKLRTPQEIKEFIARLRKGRTYSEMGSRHSKR